MGLGLNLSAWSSIVNEHLGQAGGFVTRAGLLGPDYAGRITRAGLGGRLCYAGRITRAGLGGRDYEGSLVTRAASEKWAAWASWTGGRLGISYQYPTSTSNSAVFASRFPLSAQFASPNPGLLLAKWGNRWHIRAQGYR